MTGDGQSFREKIGYVSTTRNKEDAKLMLAYAVPYPVEAHVQRLRHLEIDAVVGQAYGDFVVTENWCGRLGVAHIGQDLALVCGDAGRGKDSGVFRFGHEGADDGDTGAVGRDGVVERGRVVVVAEAVVASGDASGIWAREEGRVGESSQNHVRGAENFATVGVGGGIAQ